MDEDDEPPTLGIVKCRIKQGFGFGHPLLIGALFVTLKPS